MKMIKIPLFKTVLILQFILFCHLIAESKTPQIVLENGFYYVIQPNDERVVIIPEQEPWAYNKAKISPDGKHVFYTTANGLGFESAGRDLFFCNTNGTERTFIHKFEHYVDNWIWLINNNKNYLVVHSLEGGKALVLDISQKKLLLSFGADSVEETEDLECCKVFGSKVEKIRGGELCADELASITDKDIPMPEVFVNWMGDQVYLSTEEDPIFSSDDVLKCFEPIYDLLATQEKSSYREVHHRLSDHSASFVEEPILLVKDKIVFSIANMHGEFDLGRRRIEDLNIGGDLSINVFCSPKGKYMVFLKTEPNRIKKLIILNKTKGASWEEVLTKEFSLDADISKVEWSKQNETKIFYSLKEGAILKDSCSIDLTKNER